MSMKQVVYQMARRYMSTDRMLRVGVIGMPNVGKSTLINALTSRYLLPVSRKIDTTRSNTIAVLTHENVQIEFVDSPGIHSKLKTKRHRGKFSPRDLPHDCMSSSDLCMVVVDLSSKRTSLGHLQPEVLLHLATNRSVPSILVLNKIDQLSAPENSIDIIDSLTCGCLKGKPSTTTRRRDLKPIKLPEVEAKVIEVEGSWNRIESLDEVDFAKRESFILNQLRFIRGWPHFEDVFVVSAKRKRNTSHLRRYLLDRAAPGEWRHDGEVITTASSDELMVEAMRAAMLDNLDHELPYEVEVRLGDVRDWSEGRVMVSFQLCCFKNRHEKFLRRNRDLLAFAAARRLNGLFDEEVIVDIHI